LVPLSRLSVDIIHTGLAVAVGFAGWVGGVDAGLLSAKRPVIAILGAALYVGTAEGHLSGAGTLAIRSRVDPSVTCTGEFTSTAEAGGAGELRCSDGATAKFRFERLTVFSGHGAGSFGKGSMTFTYGLTADESKPYLKLLPGRTLKQDGDDLALVNV
jgi:hypothetical protein